ncbi:MAG: NUDIX hydrolase [Hamadaea sp.]|nr:NUDIX hydrolase [Hamadaea sp.]
MKERVRAALLDGDSLVVFRRTRPGVPVYWALPGGGVEPQDADLLAALHRELDEELRARVTTPVLLTSRQTVYPDGHAPLQHLFGCRLLEMDFDNRHGPEFSNPARGIYEVERLPFRAGALDGVRLFPEELGAYLRDNVDEVLAAVPVARGPA